MSSTVPKKFHQAPFPYFGGKRKVAALVWSRFGTPKQYIEPFGGSAAMLLACPTPAKLEVVGDRDYYVANFWRAIKFQPEETAKWADYPVTHIDLAARHAWLTQPARVVELANKLTNPEFPGDPQIAGWWVWGQCAWIGSGWCAKETQIPHVGDAGRGVQSQIPHVTDAGQGVQSQIPHVTDAGQGVQEWFRNLSRRLARVRVIHGNWDRTLNHHYGGDKTAVFLDPPYKAYEKLYSEATPVAADVEAWARENPGLRIALCGHVGDYDLPGWEVVQWSRGKLTYGGGKTTAQEAIWFSPGCVPAANDNGIDDGEDE